MHCAFSTKSRYPFIDPDLESRTSTVKRNIIERRVSRKNSRRCLRSTASNMIRGTCFGFSVVRFTDWAFILALIPPMNRWAIVIRPLHGLFGLEKKSHATDGGGGPRVVLDVG